MLSWKSASKTVGVDTDASRSSTSTTAGSDAAQTGEPNSAHSTDFAAPTTLGNAANDLAIESRPPLQQELNLLSGYSNDDESVTTNVSFETTSTKLFSSASRPSAATAPSDRPAPSSRFVKYGLATVHTIPFWVSLPLHSFGSCVRRCFWVLWKVYCRVLGLSHLHFDDQWDEGILAAIVIAINSSTFLVTVADQSEIGAFVSFDLRSSLSLLFDFLLISITTTFLILHLISMRLTPSKRCFYHYFFRFFVDRQLLVASFSLLLLMSLFCQEKVSPIEELLYGTPMSSVTTVVEIGFYVVCCVAFSFGSTSVAFVISSIGLVLLFGALILRVLSISLLPIIPLSNPVSESFRFDSYLSLLGIHMTCLLLFALFVFKALKLRRIQRLLDQVATFILRFDSSVDDHDHEEEREGEEEEDLEELMAVMMKSEESCSMFEFGVRKVVSYVEYYKKWLPVTLFKLEDEESEEDDDDSEYPLCSVDIESSRSSRSNSSRRRRRSISSSDRISENDDTRSISSSIDSSFRMPSSSSNSQLNPLNKVLLLSPTFAVLLKCSPIFISSQTNASICLQDHPSTLSSFLSFFLSRVFVIGKRFRAVVHSSELLNGEGSILLSFNTFSKVVRPINRALEVAKSLSEVRMAKMIRLLGDERHAVTLQLRITIHCGSVMSETIESERICSMNLIGPVRKELDMADSFGHRAMRIEEKEERTSIDSAETRAGSPVFLTDSVLKSSNELKYMCDVEPIELIECEMSQKRIELWRVDQWEMDDDGAEWMYHQGIRQTTESMESDPVQAEKRRQRSEREYSIQVWNRIKEGRFE